MAYKNSGNTVIDDSRNFSFSNVTIQNNGFLEIISSDNTFQGTVSGYAIGGFPTVRWSYIDKFPFASDTNATISGTLEFAVYSPTGQSSTVAGYASGGTGNPGPGSKDYIQKLSFASDSNATNIGKLSGTTSDAAGQSSSTDGYCSGGNGPGSVVTIDKFPFASDSNATDIGDLFQARLGPSGQSSSTYGYTSGGSAPPYSNTIDKFPFASDTNATDVGDASQLKAYLSGNSSETNGYITGGYNPGVPPSPYNTIDKFPFASDTNATDIGDLTQVGFSASGQSSTTSGYTSGRRSPAASNVIDKFPFASDTNATDVGDLVSARGPSCGVQD